jgi:hypothetical protein
MPFARSLMKKYIYGAVLIAIVTGVAVFFFRPPETTDRAGSTVLAITFRFPEGYEFTEGAPFALTWKAEGPTMLMAAVKIRDFNPLVSPFRLVFTPGPGAAAVTLNARLYYCHKASRMCFQDDFETRVPLVPEKTSPIPWAWEITPKKV